MLPERPVMITFDDGYESTAVYACPLLEKYGMHGIVSVIGTVATQYTENPDHNLGYSYMSWEEIAAVDSGDVLEVQCHTNNMPQTAPRVGCGKQPGEDCETYRKILEEDLSQFQLLFKRYTGHSSNVIALPLGSYCKETLSVVEKTGFRIAFTCREKINDISENDSGKIQVLRRFNRPHGISSENFFSRWEKHEK